MNRKLFTVTDRYYIQGRNGTVIVGDSQSDSPTFKVKDELVLIRPDGAEIIIEAGDIEMPLTVSGVRKIAVCVENISKEDVPIGTNVFLKIQKMK